MEPVKEQQPIAQVFTTFLSVVGKDVQACADLFAEDAVMEFPYLADTARRLEGKEAASNFFKNALFQMQDLS